MHRTASRVDGLEQALRPFARVASRRGSTASPWRLRVAARGALAASAMLVVSCSPDARAPELGTVAGVVATSADVEVRDTVLEAVLAAVPRGFFVGPNGGLWLGRLFVDEEYAPATSEPVVLLTHAFWERLGGDPSIVGAHLLVDGVRRTVVGVTAPGFSVPNGVDIWVPIPKR